MSARLRDLQNKRRQAATVQDYMDRVDDFHERCKRADFKKEMWRELYEGLCDTDIPGGDRLKGRLYLTLNDVGKANQYAMAFPGSEYSFPLFMAFMSPEADVLLCPLEDVPLYIGQQATVQIATWRLRRGK
ncbi:MAG: hypothetical protein GF334_08500 [Candidatus Altiarchaeales archaeon]|nr:hypothetical protein [Candidatus Altiarchaeales archaeon]